MRAVVISLHAFEKHLDASSLSASKGRNQGVGECEIGLIFANGNVYRYLTGTIDFWLTSFKKILGMFIFSTITKVDHIPSIAKASGYLTCIKHAFKHTQTRTHLCRESCRYTDRHTDRHTHTPLQRTMQPEDRQTNTLTDTHTH